MTSSPYRSNPNIDVVLRTTGGIADRIDIASYSRLRGFVGSSLNRDGSQGFETILRFQEGGDAVLAELSAEEIMTLWQLGLIVLPQEYAEPLASPDATAGDHEFVRCGFAPLAELVTAEANRVLVEHYRSWLASGKLINADRQASRHCVHNDPAGRVALSALRRTVERVVGSPIKGSYTYASLYRGGTDLPRHRDRPQCRYTLSLQLDHRPLPPDGRSPWPVQLYLDPDGAPLDCFQALGGGILFRGCDIAHGRPLLPPDQDSWLLLLHYVDADFEGSLD